MKVPFLDLKAQYVQIKKEIQEGINDVLENTAFILGPRVQTFEENFAKFQQTKYCVGVASGTSAIYIALKAMGIGQGDEVITTPNTFIATAAGIELAGATPVFVDIDEHTYNINPEKIEERITERTRAIIPVHLFGQPANMDEIIRIAQKYNLQVLEDAAQAHGAEYLGRFLHNGQNFTEGEKKWRRVGGLGTVSTFSFYPGKNLGAYGDGGAVCTNNAQIAEWVKMYRDHGSRVKYIHEFVGDTNRLDALQAVVLNIKLKYMDQWNEKRRRVVDWYRNYFDGVEEITLPNVPEYVKPVWHLFVIRIQNREELAQFLNENGIGTGFHYKKPLHLQQAFAHLKYKKGDFPITEKVMEEIISLPMFPEMSEAQVQYVVNKVKEFIVLHR